MREYIGDLGHISVILFFVLSILSSVSYFVSTQNSASCWKSFARLTYFLHIAAVFGIVISLFIIIQKHFYEYHYAWSHSSNFLPKEYMISCFWEGQEGSFLLWGFWHAVISLFLVFRSKEWESHVMAIFMAVQAFLASMILGVVPFETFRIGSSPFILMVETMGDLPVYLDNPSFIPADGTGLNPLLQNYWMVIHPPTLFLGFALTTIPFVYCIAGLWRNQLTAWMKPALPWLLMTGGILGLGIMMGAYWAYETLNFGGYWNWDPVENAVYVPWLIIVAAIHGITIYRAKQKAKKTSTILVIASFILILYSTFLTRSGILGESSVHSFTDLGLSGQLLIYLFFFILLSLVMLIIRWKAFGESSDLKPNTKVFWILVGIIILCIAAFQVLFATSFPVLNKIFHSKLATPTNQIAFYSNFQLWPAMFITLLSGVVQYLWWSKKVESKILVRWFVLVLAMSFFLGFILVLLFQGNTNAFAEGMSNSLLDEKTLSLIWTIVSHTFLFALSFVSVIANLIVLYKLAKTNIKLTGGAFAHLGMALMLIGILFSGPYSRIISLNQSGKVYSQDLPDDINTETVLLWRNKPEKMNGYKITYKGPRIEVEGLPSYAKPNDLLITDDPHYMIAKETLKHEGITYFQQGDTVRIFPENTYYEIAYSKKGKELFSLYPRAQVNPTMGFLASPDIKHGLTKDMYTHIATIPDPEQEVRWRDTTNLEVKVNERFFVNDYVSVLDSVMTVNTIAGSTIKEGDLGIAAFVTHKLNGQNIVSRLEMLIHNGQGFSIPSFIEDIGVKLNLLNINPQTGIFDIQYSSKQIDYVILKAEEKPLINILWIGTILMVIGFVIAFFLRLKVNQTNK